MSRLRLLVWLLITAVSNVMLAHDDVSPRVVNGKIVTDGYDDVSHLTTPNVRVFGYDFGEDPTDPFFAEDPGFHAFSGSSMPASSQLRFNVLSGGLFGFSSNLSYWDGVGAVAFGLPSSGETILLNRSINDLTVGNSLGMQTGFSLGTADIDGALHEHLFAFLQGADGNSIPAGPGIWGAGDGVEAAPGVYLLSLELTSNNLGVTHSDPIFIVYNNGLTETQHDLALDWVTQNLALPKPASVVVLSLGIAGFLGISLKRRLQLCGK